VRLVATDSKPVQCAFESHRGHPFDRRRCSLARLFGVARGMTYRWIMAGKRSGAAANEATSRNAGTRSVSGSTRGRPRDHEAAYRKAEDKLSEFRTQVVNLRSAASTVPSPTRSAPCRSRSSTSALWRASTPSYATVESAVTASRSSAAPSKRSEWMTPCPRRGTPGGAGPPIHRRPVHIQQRPDARSFRAVLPECRKRSGTRTLRPAWVSRPTYTPPTPIQHHRAAHRRRRRRTVPGTFASLLASFSVVSRFPTLCQPIKRSTGEPNGLVRVLVTTGD
jgi:hypothetical protein